jgi:hypothetical protein
VVIGNGPRGVIIGNGSTLIRWDFIDALRGIVGVEPTTLCGEVNSGISCMWQPVIGVTIM